MMERRRVDAGLAVSEDREDVRDVDVVQQPPVVLVHGVKNE